jgi:hypothetical protein
MEKRNRSSFQIPRRILALLIILLAISVVLNMFQYLSSFAPVKTLFPKLAYSGTYINGDYTDMGGLEIRLSKGLLLYPGENFDLSISYHLWDPSAAEVTLNISFKLCERNSYDEYAVIPLAERTALLHKEKGAVDAGVSSGVFALAAPSNWGVHIYKVWSGTVGSEAGYTREFAITVHKSSGIVPIRSEAYRVEHAIEAYFSPAPNGLLASLGV